MSDDNPSNPFEAPVSRDVPVSSSPGPLALFVAILVAVFLGGIVFVGTCFGTGFLAFTFLFDGSANPYLLELAWGGSALLGILTAIFAGRRSYANARKRAARRAEIASGRSSFAGKEDR